jgi:hypothetical protein
MFSKSEAQVLKIIRFKFTLAAKVLLPLLTLIYPHLQKLIYYQYDILFKITLHLLVKTITFISFKSTTINETNFKIISRLC